LHAYVDDELDLVRSVELEDHLAQCSDCADEVASYRALRDGLKAAELRYKPSPEFLARVSAALQEEQQPRRSTSTPARSFTWWNWAPAAACLVIAIASLMFYANRERETNLSKDIVADHVRSLMASHLTDVVTSDQHTVKPWFTGKLDFSPQVRDLSSNGFELIGGRLEYLDGHSAAAIVYQRRKHVINLFEWPVTGSNQDPETTAQNGFNLIEWKQSGMYYCVISDLNAQELSQFVAALRQ
jgi:anti-sigma factor RsiW